MTWPDARVAVGSSCSAVIGFGGGGGCGFAASATGSIFSAGGGAFARVNEVTHDHEQHNGAERGEHPFGTRGRFFVVALDHQVRRALLNRGRFLGGGHARCVVRRAPLGIRKDLVRLLDEREIVGIAALRLALQLEGLALESEPDVHLVRIRIDPEDLVERLLRGHRTPGRRRCEAD